MNLHNREGAWKCCYLVFLALLGLSCGGHDEPPVRIVLITLDTLRYNSFSRSENRPTSMPITHSFAEGGLIFTHHYSATSTTQPTHASIFTGLQPWQHGVIRNGMVLPRNISTLAEQMQEAGFETAAVVASFPLSRKFGFDQGFKLYDDDFIVPYTPSWSGVEVPEARFYSFANVITSKALGMLDRVRGRKQFFWFHYFDPHEPYGDTRDLHENTNHSTPIRLGNLLDEVRRDPGSARWRVAQAHQYYDKDVRFLDRALEPLFQRLREDESTVETHIIVTADHGESFGESDSIGHSKRLTEEQIHVPLFILSPRVRPAIRQDLTGSIDIHATILSLAGLNNLASGGRDLTQERLGDGVVFGMRQVFSRPFEEIRTDGKLHILKHYKFYAATDLGIYRGNSSGIDTNESDPLKNDFVMRFERLFHTFEQQIDERKTGELTDPETQKILEALGYVR